VNGVKDGWFLAIHMIYDIYIYIWRERDYKHVYMILYYLSLSYFILYCIILFLLYYFILCYIILYNIILYYIMLYYVRLYYIIYTVYHIYCFFIYNLLYWFLMIFRYFDHSFQVDVAKFVYQSADWTGVSISGFRSVLAKKIHLTCWIRWLHSVSQSHSELW
jgi:hypothetical protein